MLSRTLCFVVPVMVGIISGIACSAGDLGRSSGVGAGGGVGGVGASGAGAGGQGGTTASSSTVSTGPCTPATISGTVYDPAGKLPLYGIYAYIPAATPDPIVPGHPSCTQCQAPASGNPIVGALTDAKGHFTLSQGTGQPVPTGDGLTLVLQAGKWRRQMPLPHIAACGATVLPDPAVGSAKLRLPAKTSEGDMPLIALTSGCDPAECFLRHVGIDDSEFVPPTSATGHVHFYTGKDSGNKTTGEASSVLGGNTPAETYAWWSSPTNLLQYDIVFTACECAPNDRNSAGTGDAYAAMEAYLTAGGRMFATHYQYNWFAPMTGPTDFQSIADWNLPENLNPFYSGYWIDTTFPKGKSFADWLEAQGITQAYGQIAVIDTRWDVNHVLGPTTRWIYNADTPDNSTYATMYMSFNTPVGMPPEQQCGRAVYSDVHLSGTSDDSQFPNECVDPDKGFSSPHTVNEHALEFLFFDLSSCVQDNTMPPIVPPPTK